MKAVKIYLIVATLMLIAALLLGVYVWFTLQTLQTGEVREAAPSQTEHVESGSEVEEGPQAIQEAPPEDPIVIKKSELSDVQVKAVETLGFEGESITITPSMIACVRDELGEDRYNEILGGAAPGPIESFKLLGCVKE